MEPTDDVVKSCRICRSANQDGDFEALYIEKEGNENCFKLSSAGELYEDLLGEKIEADTRYCFPQYLCNSCDLQMRLFQKLKTKAIKTLNALNAYYTASKKKTDPNNTLQLDIEKMTQVADCMEEYTDNMLNVEAIDNTQDLLTQYKFEEGKVQLLEDKPVEEELYLEEETPSEEEFIKSEVQSSELDINTDAYFNTINDEHLENDYSNADEEQLMVLYKNEDSLTGMRNESNSDYTEYLEDGSDADEQNKSLEIVAKKATKRRTLRDYQCPACDLVFMRREDLVLHRKTIHSNKHPCPECPKLFQTGDALRVHQQLHKGLPAYQCDLCQRTFNQKVHYNYHMDRHNNIRNFKCDHCSKAFISKADLVIHTRSHTGERPYACEICGKDFLLLQHLKMHRYSHFDKSFECKLCAQKFISPSTLRTHMRTIHTSEPQFQCEFCVRKFRRKHHLISHYKVHQKQHKNDDDYHVDADDVYYVEHNITNAEYMKMSDSNDQINGILDIDDDDAIYNENIVEETGDLLL